MGLSDSLDDLHFEDVESLSELVYGILYLLVSTLEKEHFMGRVFNLGGQRSVNSWSLRRHWDRGRGMHNCLGPDWRNIYILSSSGRVSQSPSRKGLHVVGCGTV